MYISDTVTECERAVAQQLSHAAILAMKRRKLSRLAFLPQVPAVRLIAQQEHWRRNIVAGDPRAIPGCRFQTGRITLIDQGEAALKQI